MKKLTDHIKKRKIETVPIEMCEKEKIIKLKPRLSTDLSFTLEKYNPKFSIRDRLPRKNFYTVTSRPLMSSRIKHKETNLIHSSIDVFNISLGPFISLKKLKLDNCEYFDSRYLTESITHLILHSIKQIFFENITLDVLEIGYVDGQFIKNFVNCSVEELKLVNIKNFKKDLLNITFKSIQVTNCEIEFNEAIKLCQNKLLIDFIYQNGDIKFECIQNNYEMVPYLLIRNCPNIFLRFKLDKIKRLDIDRLHHLSLIKIEKIECLTYNGHEDDYKILKRFSKNRILRNINFSESGVPQNIIYDIVSECKNALRTLDISGCEISSDFLHFMRKNLKNCKIKYLNGQSIHVVNM